MRCLTMALPILLAICSTFFNTGCTTAQRKDLMDEVKLYAADEFGKLKEKVTSEFEKKVADEETKRLAALDQQLATFGTKDPETGILTQKTWKDFDLDHDGHLSIGETVSVTTYIGTQIAKRVASGEMDKAAAGNAAKSSGATIAVLAALALGRRGVQKIAGKGAPPPAGPVPPRPPPGGVVNG